MRASALAIVLLMSGVAAVAQVTDDSANSSAVPAQAAPDTSATSDAVDSTAPADAAAPASAASDESIADEATKAPPTGVAEPGSVIPTSKVADASAVTPAPTTLSAVVPPSNASPERDARGIAVISAEALVPAGFNGVAGGAGEGGPLLDPKTGEAVAPDAAPACSKTVTDHCVQAYERKAS